jgi:SAM-dependent methyltransferase
VHEILDYLPQGARVLDLGARDGSFSGDQYGHLLIVRVDIARPKQPAGAVVVGDAAKLPFASRCFDAVILNHSLEHIAGFKLALQEAGRVVKSTGAAFVAVPDSRTFSDRLYRRVFIDAGGHINAFRSDRELAAMLSWYLGLRHVATSVLYSSFSFLNRRRTAAPGTRSFTLPEPLLFVLNAVVHAADRRFHTRTSVYGWALYFGNVPGPIEPATNVCLRCGAGHTCEWLLHLGAVRRRWVLFQGYRCPDCGAWNPYAGTAAVSA